MSALTLVTGATGRVGSRLVPRLLDLGERVRVLARSAEKAAPLADRGAEVVLGDLRDPDAIKRAVAGVDAVLHVAVSFRGATDAEATAVNVDASVALARAALDAGVGRFVFTSTNLVYAAGPGRPIREDDEQTPPTEFGIYPRSKLAAENALRAMPGLGLRIVRLAFVYGEGDPHLAESLHWARQWPAHARLQLVHHADASQGLIRALHAPGIDGRDYNIADDAPITSAELFAVNGQTMPSDGARTPIDPWFGIVDTSRARRELGYRPVYPTLYTAREAGAL